MPSILEHNLWGVLAPTRGTTETPETCSPYRATLEEFVDRFATSDRRRAILDGYLRHRHELRRVGLFDAMQWVDGGFLDQKPSEPGDVDVVTLFRRPAGWTAATIKELAQREPKLFRPTAAKEEFLVEAFFVDLDENPKALVRLVAYWFGFFSHQRVTQARRGLLQIPLATLDEDARARDILEGRAKYDPGT